MIRDLLGLVLDGVISGSFSCTMSELVAEVGTSRNINMKRN